jgi:hypothetical protein
MTGSHGGTVFFPQSVIQNNNHAAGDTASQGQTSFGHTGTAKLHSITKLLSISVTVPAPVTTHPSLIQQEKYRPSLRLLGRRNVRNNIREKGAHVTNQHLRENSQFAE